MGSTALGTTGWEQSYQAAAEWFRKAADQGFAEAQEYISRCYSLGQVGGLFRTGE